jgi:CRISPR-associated protein Csb2
VIAPWRVDRSRLPDGEERRGFHRVAGRLARVTAGPLGVLELGAPEAAPPETGRVWRSATPYHPTRHPRRHDDPAAFLAEDVKAECRRRHLPEPAAVEVEALERGPRGGLTARLTLRFAGPVTGPLLLGRTAHQGGGRFAALPTSDPVRRRRAAPA